MEVSQSNLISLVGENLRIERLVDAIKGDWWVDTDTVIVNCFPPMSSSLSQMLSHMLSSRNNNEPIEVINLNMPYPNMSQVLDISNPFEYVLFDTYLRDWVRTYVRPGFKYLFATLLLRDGRDMTKVKMMMHSRLHDDFRVAALFKQQDSLFEPDYYIDEYTTKPIFSWENINNPNFKYE